jgi:hypothetical protein
VVVSALVEALRQIHRNASPPSMTETVTQRKDGIEAASPLVDSVVAGYRDAPFAASVRGEGSHTTKGRRGR